MLIAEFGGPGAPVAMPTTKDPLYQIIFDYCKIITGSMIFASAVCIFHVPNKIASGGLTGIGIILHYTVDAPIGITVFLMNLPLLYLGWRFSGGMEFFWRTAVGITTCSLAIDVLRPYLPPFVGDELLVIFYGGLMCGVGLALVFHGRGTNGGIDILGRLAHQTFGLGVGQTMLFLNIFIYVAAGLTFGAVPVMIAFMLSFVQARVLDTALSGFSASTAVIIISPRHEEIRQCVIDTLGYGVTLLDGRGGVDNVERTILYVVVPRYLAPRLRLRVLDIDPEAFFSAFEMNQVRGGYHLPEPKL